MVGAEFTISGIDDSSINKAKNMFLMFNQEISLAEKTKYGEVYFINASISLIYINGVKVATEKVFIQLQCH